MPYSTESPSQPRPRHHTQRHTPWRTPTLFWRTFLLIALLLAISLYGWYQFFVWFERGPRAQQFAHQMVSVVNLTRSSLIYAEPSERPNLLAELSANEGIRVYPLEADDKIKPLPDRKLFQLMRGYIQLELGSDTQMVGSVNDLNGLWISFAIEEDWYWAYFPKERVTRVPPLEWLSWGGLALLLSLFGALVLVRLVNRPIAQLTAAASLLASGRMPKSLPQRGPAEIRLLTASFNHMVQDLKQSEQDRTLMLAGISHDLRTPLTRLRLELEMSQLDESTRQAMASDLDQMEVIVKQFMGYARLQHSPETQEPVRLRDLIEDTLAPYQQRIQSGDLALELSLTLNDVPSLQGNPQELARLLINLLENALRYGKADETEKVRVAISLNAKADITSRTIQLSFRDHGPGVPEKQLSELTRPFKRLNTARSNANGTGLGLAIVERIVQRHRGSLEVRNLGTSNSSEHGLEFVMRFPTLNPHTLNAHKK